MALNPVVFTEKVVRSFLRYQLTTYPFADERLHAQMRRLLSLDETRQSPLMKGPYVSLSRPFRRGPQSIRALISEGVFHPHMRQRIPADITHVYGHQEDAIRAIHDRPDDTCLDRHGLRQDRVLSLPDHQQVPRAARTRTRRRDQRGHRLSDERACRGPARPPARAARGNGHPVRHVRRQDARDGEPKSPAIACLPALRAPTIEARLAQMRAEKRSDTVHPPKRSARAR